MTKNEKKAAVAVIALGALVASTGCVELEVTRASQAGQPRPLVESGTNPAAPKSGYLCVVMTPSPVKTLFAPEWKRMTVAIVTPSRKGATKAVVDFAGFAKEGAPGAFPCVPVEGTEPTVIAFEVEGHHGSVERAAQQTLAALSDGLSADVPPLKVVGQSTSRAAGGLEGVMLANGVAAAVIGSDTWCARHANSCFASFATAQDATTTLIVGPRGGAPQVRGGRVVNEKGEPAQGVALTLTLEPSPRADTLPVDCVAELENPERSQFTACATSAATASLTRGDGRAFHDLISALTLAASDTLQSTTRAVALKEARSAVCVPGRFDAACRRAASMEQELFDLREGEDAEANLKVPAACDSAAMAPAILDAASARVARHPQSLAIAKQTKALSSLAHDNRVACFKERAIAGCGPDCPLGWLSKVTALSGSRLVLGYDEEGCRANSLARFVGGVRSAAANLMGVDEIRETVSAVGSPEQERITSKWCSEVVRLSDALRTSALFREMDAADLSLRGLPPAIRDVEVNGGAPQRYAPLKGRSPAERVAALLEEGETLRKHLPGLFGSAEDGAPKLRDGAQDRLEGDVNCHIRYVRDYVERATAAERLASGPESPPKDPSPQQRQQPTPSAPPGA